MKNRVCAYVTYFINFVNCSTWLFSNEYVYEHNFAVWGTWSNLKKLNVHIFNNNLYFTFLKERMCFSCHILYFPSCLKSYYSFLKVYDVAVYWLPLTLHWLMIKVEDSRRKRWELTPRWSVWNAFILWNSKKYKATYLRENAMFFPFYNLVTLILQQFNTPY